MPNFPLLLLFAQVTSHNKKKKKIINCSDNTINSIFTKLRHISQNVSIIYEKLNLANPKTLVIN